MRFVLDALPNVAYSVRMSNYLVPFLILAGVLGWVLAITLLVVLFGKGTALADRIEIDGEQPDDLGHRKPSHTNRLYREN